MTTPPSMRRPLLATPMARGCLIAAMVLTSLGCEGTSEDTSPEPMTPSADMPGDVTPDASMPDLNQGDDHAPQPDADMTPEQDQAQDQDQDQYQAQDQDEAADMIPSGPPRSAGCVDGAGLSEGEHTFMLEDRARRYIVRLPTDYSRAKPWPLVLALHGNDGNISYWDQTSGQRNIRAALEDEAVLIIAEAIEGSWRDYDEPSSAWPARVESELLYFEEVITQAKGALCLNEDAIFAMGFSGGGSFAGVLGCRREDIRAIAAGGAVLYFDEASCISTPASWITIGTEELNSGREAFRDLFRERAGCEPTSTPTAPEPCVAYDGCDTRTPVHYCQHPAGHVWPGFGAQAMWGFFASLIAQP